MATATLVQYHDARPRSPLKQHSPIKHHTPILRNRAPSNATTDTNMSSSDAASTMLPLITERKKRVKIFPDDSETLEQYYFARTFRAKSKSLSIQIQRLHKNTHTEPVFNVKQTARRTPKKIKNVISIPSIRTTADTESELLYDGTQVPISISGETAVYGAFHYDSANSEREIAQFSRYGVFFLPSSTPILSPGSTIRSSRVDPSLSSGATASAAAAAAGECARSASMRRSLSSMTTASSALCDLDEATLDLYFRQPVTWLLVPDGSGYKVVDQSTNMTVGKWAPRKATPSGAAAANSSNINAPATITSNAFTKKSEQQWYFVSKSVVLAKVDNGHVRVMDGPDNGLYVDDYARKMRNKFKTKQKRASMPARAQSIPNSILAAANPNTKSNSGSKTRRRSSSSSSATYSGTTTPTNMTATSSPPPSIKLSSSKFRNSIPSLSSLKKSSSTNCIPTLGSTAGSATHYSISSYRARFVDGIVFSSLALLLTLDADTETTRAMSLTSVRSPRTPSPPPPQRAPPPPPPPPQVSHLVTNGSNINMTAQSRLDEKDISERQGKRIKRLSGFFKGIFKK